VVTENPNIPICSTIVRITLETPSYLAYIANEIDVIAFLDGALLERILYLWSTVSMHAHNFMCWAKSTWVMHADIRPFSSKVSGSRFCRFATRAPSPPTPPLQHSSTRNSLQPTHFEPPHCQAQPRASVLTVASSKSNLPFTSMLVTLP
jgi:hypothetical protein